MLQESSRVLASVFVLDLRSSLQRWQIIRRNLQGVAERAERFPLVSVPRQSDAAKGPQSRILGVFYQFGLQELQCGAKLSRAQRGSNGCKAIGSLRNNKRTASKQGGQHVKTNGKTHRS